MSAALVVLFVLGRTATPGRVVLPPGPPIAVVERVDQSAISLQPGDSIRVGEWIETTAEARVALRFADGTSVRFDAASRARPLSANIIELTAGAVYVDSAPASAGFEVQTPIATVRDVGTQFEVRVQSAATRVRVRSGKVELRHGTRVVSGEAGTEVTMSAERRGEPTDRISQPGVGVDRQRGARARHRRPCALGVSRSDLEGAWLERAVCRSRTGSRRLDDRAPWLDPWTAAS